MRLRVSHDLLSVVCCTGLDAGDYLCDRCGCGGRTASDCAVVERKSLPGLCGTASHGRRRVEAELARMRPYGSRAVVIEAEWTQKAAGSAGSVKRSSGGHC